MNYNLVFDLGEIVAKLVGTTCLRVSGRGGATGSRFNLHLSTIIEDSSESSAIRGDENVSSEEIRGEFGVLVGCAAWRLDDENAPVTASTDVATPEGPMVQWLQKLRDRVVTRAEIATPGHDLLLEFDNKYTLRVFCDQFVEPLDNYSVRVGNRYVCVGARSSVGCDL